MRWPFHRAIHEQLTKIEGRLRHVEERQVQEKGDVGAVEDRLDLLEAQASVIAQTHLKRRQDTRRDDPEAAMRRKEESH